MTRCDGTCLSYLSGSSWPFLSKNPLFWCKRRRREGGIAYSMGGPSRLVVLSTVFLKSNTLGRFACLRSSPNRRVCVLSLSPKTDQKCGFFTASWQFSAGLEWRSHPDQSLSYTAPAVLRLCSSKSLIRGALPKVSAQKTPGAPRPTLDAADCCGLEASFVDQERNSVSRARYVLAAPPLHHALCFINVSSSNPKTANSITDEGNTETVSVCCLC